MSSKRKRKREPGKRDNVAAPPAAKRTRLPAWKKLLFAAGTTVAFFGCFEGVLVLWGVQSPSYDKDPYLGFSSQAPLFVERAGSDGRVEMVTAKNKRPWFNLQRFPKTKPRKTYRIFCLGGSTTYGRPYNDVTSFAGWLRAFLPEADPSRQWELINAGGISYASYRLALLTEEMVRYAPDLFIIYTGHNEFLERRTYPRLIRTPRAVRGLGVLLSRTRTYAIVKRLVDLLRGTKRDETDTAEKRDLLQGEVNAILDASVGPKYYHRDDRFQKQVLDHFRFNLVRIIQMIRSAGARVLLVTPASNLLHCTPFKSEHRAGLADTELARWQALIRRAHKASAAEMWSEALIALDEAATIDDRYAELHYLRGRVLYRLKRFAEAKAALEHARDEDICPLRALGSITRIVAEVAAEWDVPLVDFRALVERRSDHGIPGDNVFLDHVHPTIDTNRSLALAILEEMTRQGIVTPAPGWGEGAIARVTRRVESGLDRQFHATALRNLAKVFSWAGKYEEADKLAAKAAELLPRDPTVVFQMGVAAQRRGDLDKAFDFYRQTIQLAPNFAPAHTNISAPLMKRGQLDLAVKHLRRAIALDPDNPIALFNLAEILRKQGKLQPAAEHFRRLIRLHPRDAEVRAQLAEVLRRLGRFAEATAEMERAVGLSSKDARMHDKLGQLQAATGNFRAAAQSYRRALQLDAKYDDAMDHLAWLLATCPEDDVRDGPAAIRLAEQACATATAEKKPAALDTLAAAYAEAGRFPEAIATAGRALVMARSRQSPSAEKIGRRLEDYKAGRPCRVQP